MCLLMDFDRRQGKGGILCLPVFDIMLSTAYGRVTDDMSSSMAETFIICHPVLLMMASYHPG